MRLEIHDVTWCLYPTHMGCASFIWCGVVHHLIICFGVIIIGHMVLLSNGAMGRAEGVAFLSQHT